MRLPDGRFAILLVSGLLFCCGGSGGGSGVTIHLTSSGFSPSTVNIRVGSSLTFVNDDNKTHTVVSQQCPDISGSQLRPAASYTVSIGNNARSCDISDSEAPTAQNYTGVIHITAAG